MRIADQNVERVVAWKRLDVPGMDACRLLSAPDGWLIDGAAVFVAGGSVAKLTYEVACLKDWRTRTASVKGWIGERSYSLRLERSETSGWVANGVPLEGVAALEDVDLGFTPATNTNAIRRLALRPGDEAETTAVWLDTDDWTLKPLHQTYRRLSGTRFAYASPAHGYRAELKVDPTGVVIDYPGLWLAT